MKLVGEAKIPCIILATTAHPTNIKKSSFNSYTYTLFLDQFCVFIVTVRCKLCKISGTETQPSQLTSVEHFVDQSSHMFTHDVT